MENTIFRCLECDELFCPTRYDKYSSYGFDQTDGVFYEKFADDLDVFNSAHKNHNIEELTIVDGSFCSKIPYWEPIRDDYIKVDNGTDIFTVRRWRNNINEPIKYEIVDFNIIIGDPILSIQSENIKKQMLADSKAYGFDSAIIESFICLFDNFVSQINMNNLLETGFSMNDPMVSYAKMDSQSNEKFIKLCQQMIGSGRINAIRKFIDDNSEYDDVMNIQIDRHFWLKSTNERIILKKV